MLPQLFQLGFGAVFFSAGEVALDPQVHVPNQSPPACPATSDFLLLQYTSAAVAPELKQCKTPLLYGVGL